MTLQANRRSFIAAIPAAAVAVAIPASALAAPADRRAWEFALARYQAALQTSDDYDAQTFYPLYERQKAVELANGIDFAKSTYPGEMVDKRAAFIAEHGTSHTVPEEVNDRRDQLAALVGDAACEALDTPAPDLAALRWKLDFLAGEGWDGWANKQIDHDIARLLPTAA